MLFERDFRLFVDDRPDVGVRARRVADSQLHHRAGEHLEHARRRFLLHQEDAQRRAALARAVEGRRQQVGHHLLGQRGGVHHHRVQAPGLRDERNDGTVARSERPVDGERGLERSGEGDACHAGIAHERGADGVSGSGDDAQHVVRHARFVEERRGARRHEGCLFRRFCHHRVSRGERRAHLAREDRERKVPRADTREDAAAGQLEPVRFARRSGQLQRSGEIPRAPAPRNSAESRPFPALRRRRRAGTCRLRAREAKSARLRHLRPRRPPVRVPRRARPPGVSSHPRQAAAAAATAPRTSPADA